MKFGINLQRKISQKTFIISNLLILTLGLAAIFILYYIINLQYPLSQRPFQKGPVTTAPKTLRLELEQPDNDVLSFESSIIISGKTGPSLNVLIFSESEDKVLKSNPDGSFSTVFNLEEGINHIWVEIFDISGDKKMEERLVFYSKEKI